MARKKYKPKEIVAKLRQVEVVPARGQQAETQLVDREAEFDRLHAKIGELVVERGFLRKASGR